MMLRSFLPVGQGAFYLERFETKGERINVVYDCGSLTDVKIVEKEIRSNFSKGEEIKIVFISHVDQDHINGLEYLLTYCNVKNIVFPYTKRKDRITLTVDYFCNKINPSYDDFTCEFISNPSNALRRYDSDARLWGISDEYDSNESNDRDHYNEDEEFKVIRSGENLFEYLIDNRIISKIKWEYVPFNFREDNRKQQFIDELDNNLRLIGKSIAQIGIDNILKQWADSDIQKAIIDAYKNVKGSLNTNSMVLFSGIRDNNIHQWNINLYHRFCYCRHKCIDFYEYYLRKNGCLYTGDYEAKGKCKWLELKNAYSKYWDYIGCVQIPHHGSYRNYNKEFALLDSYFVISAGYNSKYHPSGSVLKDLLLKDKYPLIVTEQHNSEVILKVDI